MLEKILFLTHTDAAGDLPKLALETLSAARLLCDALDGAALEVGLIGGSVTDAADAIAGCGAKGFVAVMGDEYAVSRYASDATAAEAVVRASGATLVLAPGTSRFARAIPGVAQRVDGRIDTNVTTFTASGGVPRIERWYYRQRMLARMTRVHRPWFVLLAPGAAEPWSGDSGSASVEVLDMKAPTLRTRVVGEEVAAAEGAQTIRPDAELLFVAGAGWTKKQSDGRFHVKEAERIIASFLENSGASLGGSKSIVEQSGEGQEVLSIMSHLNQVGQTGATPRHPKGLATCCHGEEPHVVGWRFIQERRAVNLDPGCGWARGKADVVYVADAFEVLEKVNELLGKTGPDVL